MLKSQKKVVRRSATLVALINGASALGYAFSGGFEAACASAKKLVPSTYLTLSEEQRKVYAPQIADFGRHFKAGHLLRYLEMRGYNKRFGNMDEPAKIAECLTIFDKARPDNLEKTDRRTALEHLGCRTADNAWSRVRDAAGLKLPAPKRAPAKRRAAGDEKKVPTARITVPKFHAPIDAVPFFNNVSADLLKVVNENAKDTPSVYKSAVQDFRKAIREAAAALKTGATSKKAAKAKAPSAAVIAAKAAQPNGSGATA